MPRETRAMTLARCLPVDGSWTVNDCSLQELFVAARGGYERTSGYAERHYSTAVTDAIVDGWVELRHVEHCLNLRLTDKGRAAVAGGAP